MGVLVFLLAVIQMTGGSNMNLLRAESPGPAVGKLVPRMMHSKNFICDLPWNDSDSFCVTGVWENVGI